MKKILFVLSLTALFYFSQAQTPMNGTYTIGASTWVRNYNTITDAVNALQTNGIKGPVTFNIYPGRYYEQIEIPTITGASASNRITFQSVNNDTNSVYVVYCPKWDSNYVVLLDGADYLTFRDMTFTPDTSICTNHKAYKNIFVLENTNEGIHFIGNRFIGVVNAANGQSILSDKNITNNVIINRNSFYYNETAITLISPSKNQFNHNLTFEFNKIFKQDESSVRIHYVKNADINSNFCFNYLICFSLSLYGKNNISNNTLISKSIFSPSIIVGNSRTASQYSNIFNNYIYSFGKGLYIAESDSLNIYHNTIIAITPSSNYYPCLEIYGTLTTKSEDINIFNNLLISKQTGYAFVCNNYSSGDIIHDNNVYQGKFRLNSTVMDYQGFKSMTGQDQHSAYFSPNFEPDSMHTKDLRLKIGAPIHHIVSRDIDGEIRDAYKPFVGCDEFKAVNIGSDIIHLCKGDSIRLAVDSSLQNYQWSTGDASWFSRIKAPSFSGDTIVTVSAIKNNVSFYDSVIVRFHDLFAHVGPDTSLCSGSNLDIIGQGNASLLWNDTYSGDTLSLVVDDTLRVVLKVFNEHGCAAYDTIMVNGWHKPVVDFNNLVRICDYDHYVLTAPSQPNVTYTWKKNNLPDTISTDSFLHIDKSGNYTAILQSSFGCITSSTQQVDVKKSPAKPQLFYTPNDSFCFGDSIFVYFNKLKDHKYFWNGMLSTDTGIYVSSTDTISATLSYRACYSDTAELSVVEKDQMQKPVIVSPTQFKGCQGDSAQLYTSVPYSQYQWMHGSTSDTVYFLSNGLTRVKVWDEIGCESPYSDVVTINFYLKPSKPGISSSNGNSFCEGDSTLLTGPAGYLHYIWSGKGLDTIEQKVAKLAGNYWLRVMDTNFCTSDFSSKYAITLKPAPVVPMIQGIPDTVFCEGDSVFLTTVPNNLPAYFWQDGDTARVRYVSSNGSFQVKAIGSNLCESEFSPVVTTLEKSRTAKPSIVKVGTDSLQSSLLASSYNWYLGNNPLGLHDRTILAVNKGDYEVATVENGCESERSDALYFIPSGINDVKRDNLVKVYPNPNKGEFVLESGKELNDELISIYDIHGKLIHQIKTMRQSKVNINLGNAPGGMYIMVLKGYHFLIRIN